MKQDSDIRTTDTDLTWLRNDDPEIYHLLLALDGDLDALLWLKKHGDGLFQRVVLHHQRDRSEALLEQVLRCGKDVVGGGGEECRAGPGPGTVDHRRRTQRGARGTGAET